MAIRYRKDKGSWQVYWNNPFTGKRESVSFATEAEAKKEESLVKHRLKFDRDSFKREETENEGIEVDSELTLSQVYMRYLKEKQFGKKSLIWQMDSMKTCLQKYGEAGLSQITKEGVQELMNAMLKRGVSAHCVHNRFSVLKAVLRWSANNGFCEAIPFPKLPSFHVEQLVPPSQEELSKMMEAAEPHIQRVIILGSQCGMRIGPCELFQLTWEDVDLRQQVLRVHGSKKNKNALRREVPIRDSLLPIMEQWYEEDKKSGDIFLIHFNGKPVQSIKTAWIATLRRAGITRRIRPYDLRHVFATEAIAAGADIGTVAKLMGHSSATMILTHYQFVMDKQKRAVVEALPEIKYVPRNMCPKN